MARFGEINAQYFDDAGDPLGSGKLYFYDTGTTTLKNTYSDINFTIPNPNPVILTAAGRQPNIFFNGVAKAILANSSDVQILVRDPVGETGTNFGDPWIATKVYSTNSVVIGSDGVYYRSLVAGNQNNNPATTSGFWSLLYSVQWNAGITYQEGSVVTYNGEQFQSLTNSNLNNNPSTSSANWVLLSFAWISTATYADNQNAVGSDGVLYTSQQGSNTNKNPTVAGNRPAYWVGTSADAATSAAAAATSATNAATSASGASTSATNAATSATNAGNSATAAATSATDSAASAAASAATAGAALWVSGQTYNAGDAAISLVNFLTYRAETTTSGTTDPSADANWTQLGYSLPSQTGNSGKFLTTNGTAESWGIVESLPSQTGNAGKYLTTDGTDESWADVGGATVDIVASGALPNGNVVQINSDGTVSTPTLSTVSSPTATQYNGSVTGTYSAACFDPVNQQVYVVWWDSTTYWNCSVAALSGNVLTFVTTTMAFSNAQAAGCVARYIPSANQVLFAWKYSTYTVRIIAIKADSAGVATSGTHVTHDAQYDSVKDMGYDPVTGKAILYFVNYYPLNCHAFLLSVSGTTITKGNLVSVTSTSDPNHLVSTYDSVAQKHIVVESVNGSGNVVASVVTVSGSSISVAGATTLTSAFGRSIPMYHSGVDRTVVTYVSDSTDYVSGIVLSLSGTTLTASSATQFNTLTTGSTNCAPIFYDSPTGKSYVAINTLMYELTVTTSGVSLTTGTSLFNRGSFDGPNPQFGTFYDVSSGMYFSVYINGPKSYAAFLTETDLRPTDIIGVVTSAYTNGQTATISVVSSAATISGVASSVKYYAQKDGTVGTTDTGAYIGLGIGSNTLLVKA